MASKSVQLYPLGRNGPKIPQIGFGLMGLSGHSYGESIGDEEAFRILDRAYELGNVFWDTADLYNDGEALVGRWFKRTGKRNEIFLATKFGFVKGSPTYEVDSSAEYCKEACAASLKALDIDSIDLYYVHNANPKTPIEETMRALVELQREGKIKHIGLSAVSATTLRRACKIAPVAAVQTEYSVFARDLEGPKGQNILATARELGVAVVCATPLGRGILTSTFSKGEALSNSASDSRTRVMPQFQEGNRDKNVEVVAQFKAFAEKKGCSVSALALAWLIKQGHDVFPIPGTKKMKYMEDNWSALQVNLSDQEEAEIRAFAEGTNLSGPSNPEQFHSYLYRDTVEESG